MAHLPREESPRTLAQSPCWSRLGAMLDFASEATPLKWTCQVLEGGPGVVFRGVALGGQACLLYTSDAADE